MLNKEELAKAKIQFRNQKRNTGGRIDKLKNPIEFKLTFEEWLKIWLDSGHYQERGRGRGQYCMSRNNDIGHYEIGNVTIKLTSLNNAEGHSKDIKKLRPGPRTDYKDTFMPKMTAESLAKFHASYIKGEPDECWIWTGLTANAGPKGKIPPYGIMNTTFVDSKAKLMMAHRIMYLLVHGVIPGGKSVRHSCNEPKCVNPAHLYVASRPEIHATSNWKDGGSKHAGNKVKCPHCGKEGGQYIMNRWHMDRCPHKPNE